MKRLRRVTVGVGRTSHDQGERVFAKEPEGLVPPASSQHRRPRRVARLPPPAIRPQIHHVDSHDVCRVQVDPDGFPVDAKVVVQKSGGPKGIRTEFYVRVANGTRALDAVERGKYIVGRWAAGGRGETCSEATGRISSPGSLSVSGLTPGESRTPDLRVVIPDVLRRP